MTEFFLFTYCEKGSVGAAETTRFTVAGDWPTRFNLRK